MKTENVKKSDRTSRTKHIGLVRNDSYLEPFEEAIKGRHEHALWKLGCLTRNGKTKLSDFANGHNYYGLHKLKRGWVFREWASITWDRYTSPGLTLSCRKSSLDASVISLTYSSISFTFFPIP